MNDQAGFGASSWLPATAARQIAQQEIADRREERIAAAGRERALEERHRAALECYREQAEARGEVVDVLAIAAGGAGLGRSIQDVFDEARRAADYADAREVARVKREGQGRPVPLTHVDFDEPQIHSAARSEVGRSIFNRHRRWLDARDKRRAAEAAEARTRDDFPLGRPVTLRSPGAADPAAPAAPVTLQDVRRGWQA